MKAVWMVMLAILVMAGSVIAEEPVLLKSEKDKISYIIGLDIGNNLKRQNADIDPDMLLRGMKDALSGNKPLLSENEIREITAAFRQEMAKKQAEETKKLAEKNKREGEVFFEQNKKKEGVKTLPSGLQYKIITEGSGKSPKESDTVTVNYKGTLLDGTEFDSSYKRGEPATFPVKGVIAGWVEALQLMKEGAKWQLFIPPGLAYGETGAGNTIGPNATLIFEVELISIK
jgi:FKBP-type peptidyl-prolyl cis-trans isomerase FklB